MNRETIYQSIQGISREINRRRSSLDYIRRWLSNRSTHAEKFTMVYCYTKGPKLMNDIARLSAIREDLKKINRAMSCISNKFMHI